ncbi:hypothetical protein COEREDRAFT_87342 [Coemansia reversa NRRL 1564]|uniref:CS domain-containing protein n=1 Tax=Coemansia reversa (strain ATCC 12441 / NRRL 1564) TaxID=763665 RepID=A0A2G5BAU3_COERN|nr:hypothetical protein COEREDRAFT_87342 [Coemansia reversa NRRL 1564]|eukprot:PIA16136.1 hypothetical protein COEREDRAFT_87342 [Coemansia reversa NRRL 1564]
MLDYGRFEAIHKQQLEALDLPRALWKVLHKKIVQESFDIGEWVVFAEAEADNDDSNSCAAGITNSRLCLNKEELAALETVFLVDHAWTTSISQALSDLNNIPGLLERMERLTGVYESKNEAPQAFRAENVESTVTVNVPAVVSQTGVSEERARELLQRTGGDIVEAIMMANDETANGGGAGNNMPEHIQSQILQQLETSSEQNGKKPTKWATRSYECIQHSLDGGNELDGIEIRLPLAPGVQSGETKCAVLPSHLTVSIAGRTIIDGDLHAQVDTSISTWSIEDGVLCIALVKQKPEYWSEAIVGESRISPKLHQKHLLRVFRELWRYLQGYDYLAQGADQSISKRTNWYVQDEVGLAVAHCDDPNVRCLPFLYVNDHGQMMPYSILWPIKSITQGEPLSRDYCPRWLTDPIQRAAYLQAIFQGPTQGMLNAREQLVRKWNQIAADATRSTLAIQPTPTQHLRSLYVRDATSEVQSAITTAGYDLASTPEDADVVFDDIQHEGKLTCRHGINTALIDTDSAIATFQHVAGAQSWLSKGFSLRTQIAEFIGTALVDTNAWWLLTSAQTQPGVASPQILTSSWVAAVRHADVGYSTATECNLFTAVPDRLFLAEWIVLLTPDRGVYLWGESPRFIQHKLEMLDDSPAPYQALAPASAVSEDELKRSIANQLGSESFVEFTTKSEHAIADAVNLLLSAVSGPENKFGVFRFRFALEKGPDSMLPVLHEARTMTVAEQLSQSPNFIPAIAAVLSGRSSRTQWRQIGLE